MGKAKGFNIMVIVLLLVTSVISMILSLSIVSNKAACSLSDMINISYYYQGNKLSYISIASGEKIESALSYEMYSEEVTLEEGYILVWHIGSIDGQEWSKDYIFYQDTDLHGVPVEGQEEEIIVDNPNENTDNTDNTDGDSEQSGELPKEDNIPKEPDGEESTANPVLIAEYKITLENVKGDYTITGELIKGKIITVVFEQGDSFSAITAVSGNKQLTLYRNGNEVRFYMPDGDVTINCYYEETSVSEDNKKLTKNEIIALSVVGGCALSYGIFLIIKRVVKQKSK